MKNTKMLFIDEEIGNNAEAIIENEGLTMSEFVNEILSRIVAMGWLPENNDDLEIPSRLIVRNKEELYRKLDEAEKGEGIDSDEVFRELM